MPGTQMLSISTWLYGCDWAVEAHRGDAPMGGTKDREWMTVENKRQCLREGYIGKCEMGVSKTWQQKPSRLFASIRFARSSLIPGSKGKKCGTGKEKVTKILRSRERERQKEMPW